MYSFIENASLRPYNTFGMDVKGKLLIEYQDIEDLKAVFRNSQVRQLMQQEEQAGRLPFWHIGSGSNLLFQGDYPGVILHCTRKGIREGKDDTLEVEAGTLWDDVCDYCARHGLYGAENLSLIPGETGAAAVQNIGAYGVEMKDIVEKVICYDIYEECPRIFSCEEMHYGYRESRLKHLEYKRRYIVTTVVLKVSHEPVLHLEYKGLREALGLDQNVSLQPPIREVRNAVIRIRQGKLPDPRELGNAGSFFKNPVVENSIYERLAAQYPGMPHYVVDESHTKIPAGWLIEQCGWKGKSLGKAGVYQKQSLVLVNLGGAKPEEIVRLCNTIIRDVKAQFGIMISPEVNII